MEQSASIGYCQCGCGNKTTVPAYNNTNRGIKKGKPMDFIRGHQIGRGSENHSWNGGKHVANGYMMVLKPRHHRADRYGYIQEHILIAEEVLGKPLPPRSVIHHADGNSLNNNKNNIVICTDQAYHLFLHQRTSAFNAIGDANYLKCQFCGEHENPKNLYVYPSKNRGYHRNCYNEERKRRTAQ